VDERHKEAGFLADKDERVQGAKAKYRQCHYIAEHSAPLSSDLLFSLSVDLKAYFWALRWTPGSLYASGQQPIFPWCVCSGFEHCCLQGPLTSAYMSAN